MFDTLISLDDVSSVARGEGAREPQLNQVIEELPAGARGAGRQVVPCDRSRLLPRRACRRRRNISDKIISDQMKVLNAAFAGFYGGAATGFKFDLVAVTRTDNAAWHFAAGPGRTHAGRVAVLPSRRQGH